MSMKRNAPEAFSLRRWSQRKHAATRGERSAVETPPVVAETAPPADAGPPSPAPVAVHESSTEARVERADDATPALPPLESLTFESDFTAFMQPDVDENVRRTALRTLLRDPRFNVMDGLDVYIDDYSKPDPIEPALVRTLVQARYLFDPPKTRVNAEGFVEDVVEDSVDDATKPADEVATGAPVSDAPASDAEIGDLKERNDDERA
jgi:hypothetical protein